MPQPNGPDPSLPSLTRTEFPTELGTIPLWHGEGALASRKPVLLTVTGTFAPITTMSKMQLVVGDACDCFLMHLPGNHSPVLAEATVAAYARALSEVVEREFADRPVVLTGVSIGALVAVAVRAAPVRRIVAIEPPIRTGKLWPMLNPLAKKLKAQPDDRVLHDFVDGVFGVTATARRDIDYRPLFEDLATPVDVVIGDRPLMPERKQESYPSFVDAPEREWLAALPNVEVHVAPETGHNVPFQAPFFLKAILLDAMLSVGGTPDLTPADRDLLSRAPIAADRVLYAGPAEAAFRAAYLRRNPKAKVATWASLGEARDGPYDLVLLSRFTAEDGPRLASLLADGGAVAAVAEAAALPLLDRAPFSLVRLLPPAADGQAFDDRRAEPGAPPWPRVAVARKAAAATPLFVRMASFAPRLMDVRTRLPAQGLRTDPELVTALGGPQFNLTDEPSDRPKVLILQRPALVGAEAWRKAVAQSLVNGWVVVLEADDHPELMAEVMGQRAAPEAWERFGYVHAVQTSTPQLAEAFGRYNPEVKVFANCAFDLTPWPRTPGPRRVFYGAVTRGPFATRVAASLGPAAAAFPDVEWLVLGDKQVFEALPAQNKRFVPYVDYDEYLRLMGTCAVSLSPIEGLPFQDTKSDVKFVEAASRGTVTLASPTIYEGTIRHGENGLIARRVEDWAPLLTGLLADEPGRLAMARRAWSEVRDARMFAQQLPDRRAWYQDLWARREALTEGLKARLPGLAEALG